VTAARRGTRALAVLALVVVCGLGTLAWLSTSACGDAVPRRGSGEIGQCWFLPHEGAAVAWRRLARGTPPLAGRPDDFARERPPGFSRPVPHVPLARHPFMAAGGSNMHSDASMSDAHAAAGPVGLDPRVVTRTQGFGGYGTLAFDRGGRIVAVYSNGGGFQLELMDPDTLEELASWNLPARPWYFPLQGVLPWKYIGAGMYFYLDERDRAVVPTTRNTVEVVQAPPVGSGDGFRRVRTYDLAEAVVAMRWPQRDSVAWVLPEWNGRRYWYATLRGIVGTVEVESGVVRTLRLDGEIVENSFAVGEDGVFIVSDRALYRFAAGDAGEPVVRWRAPYDRGPAAKPGHLTRGSGSSVTLAGGPAGLVVITDNAEPRIHVEFFRRADGARVCRVPVFTPGQSGTDLSPIAFEHADEHGAGSGRYSSIVENNWGHHAFPRPRPVPGLTRVDARREADGSFTCAAVWESREKSLGIPKLSLGSGLVYVYGPDDVPDATGWSFTAIDFATGETVFRRRAGIGHGFNNWQGALFLHPANGAAYTTTIFGLAMLRDTEGGMPDRADDGPRRARP